MIYYPTNNDLQEWKKEETTNECLLNLINGFKSDFEMFKQYCIFSEAQCPYIIRRVLRDNSKLFNNYQLPSTFSVLATDEQISQKKIEDEKETALYLLGREADAEEKRLKEENAKFWNSFFSFFTSKPRVIINNTINNTVNNNFFF